MNWAKKKRGIFSQKRASIKGWLMVLWEGKLRVHPRCTGRLLLPTQERKHKALGNGHGKLLNSR